MPEDYEVELTQLANGHAVDSRIYPDLQQMFDDARAEGLMPTISSSYRTADKQQQILDDKLAAYENEGNSYEDAKELAEAWVAIPGTSEHQLGIAVDITSADREAQSPDVIWEWLEKHCCEYGFIVRYPEEKSDITGVINEPWHFRYVGREAAEEITKQGVCLEEYLGRTEH
ncbi:MAG TPA: D-Ala-D-Ala carboxypeptidase VanY [Lachnospiraceae bacterium]|nr:D-Ala-D-Ala carboxypeptidase VanY [Lachnospiraceae bacterium]